MKNKFLFLLLFLIVSCSTQINQNPMPSGAINLDITQDNINLTICNPNWSTKSIRPPVSYTNNLKKMQMIEYKYTDLNPADYEEDHLIPLELGGNPTDINNLWAEPIDEARKKDKVENYLHKKVCDNYITLQEAQKEIIDWQPIYAQIKR